MDTFFATLLLKKVSKAGIHEAANWHRSRNRPDHYPMKKELTWVADEKRKSGGRWRKKHRGETFWFSDIEGKSDRAGYKRAIEAFKIWRAKIDLQKQQNKPHQDDYNEAIGLRKDMLAWLATEQDPDPIRVRLLAEVKTLEAEFAKPKPRPLTETGIILDPIHRSVMSMEDVMAWLERLDSLRQHQRWTRNSATDNTLDGHIGDFLAMQLTRARSGQIKVTTYKGYKERTGYFRRWLQDNSRTEITAKAVTAYNNHLLMLIGKGDITEQHGASLFSQARSVIRWLWRHGACELPNNLDDSLLTIQVTLKEIAPFTNDELQVIWTNASERTKLYALLMLNCGMLPTDIAELRASEYDGQKITRRRTKTGKRTTSGRGKNVPVVSWKLWDETRRLLDKHRTHGEEFLLHNEDGGKLVRNVIKDDGEVSSVDNIDCAWDRLVVKMKKKGVIVRPLANLRKTGPSKLEEHSDFGRYAQFFLGQAPDSMTESRYAKPSQDVFDRALTWLGQQFGF